MPKYTFTCNSCQSTKQSYTSVTTKQCPCECGEQMSRQLPNIRGVQVNELIDKYANKSLVADHNEILKES